MRGPASRIGMCARGRVFTQYCVGVQIHDHITSHHICSELENDVTGERWCVLPGVSWTTHSPAMVHGCPLLCPSVRQAPGSWALHPARKMLLMLATTPAYFGCIARFSLSQSKDVSGTGLRNQPINHVRRLESQSTLFSHISKLVH